MTLCSGYLAYLSWWYSVDPKLKFGCNNKNSDMKSSIDYNPQINNTLRKEVIYYTLTGFFVFLQF